MATKRSRPANRSRSSTRLYRRKRKARREMAIELNGLGIQNNAVDASTSQTLDTGPPPPQPAAETNPEVQPNCSILSEAWSSRLSKVGLWLGVGVAIGALIVAIWYGFWNYQMQKWQADKEFRDMCMSLSTFMSTNTLSTDCAKALHKMAKPPPFTRRWPNIDGSYYPDGSRGRDFAYEPVNKGLAWTLSGSAFTRDQQSGNWLLETLLTTITTFLATPIFTSFILFWHEVDPAKSNYPLGSHISDPPRSRFCFLVGTFLGFVVLSTGSSGLNAPAFAYYVTVAGAVHTIIAVATRNVNYVAILLSLAAVTWVARNIEFRRVPRRIGWEAEGRDPRMDWVSSRMKPKLL